MSHGRRQTWSTSVDCANEAKAEDELRLRRRERWWQTRRSRREAERESSRRRETQRERCRGRRREKGAERDAERDAERERVAYTSNESQKCWSSCCALAIIREGATVALHVEIDLHEHTNGCRQRRASSASSTTHSSNIHAGLLRRARVTTPATLLS